MQLGEEDQLSSRIRFQIEDMDAEAASETKAPPAGSETPDEAAKDEADKLGVLPATAICGNDITSSCLYVSALTIMAAGRWAPLALLVVVLVLYLFRKIYGEVVGALPLNGGAYNALLNTTSKSWASLAACLTLLSYMATAVISASEAMHYFHGLVPVVEGLTPTVVLLAVFCALTIWGIGESSMVAVGIFILHLASLVLLLAVGGIFLAGNGFDILKENLATPTQGGMGKALFLGFAAAMLGISGFESSANYVEEQKKGVFPKTLRNMWLAVGIFNPLMALLALSLIRIGDVEEKKNALLAHMGSLAGGEWLATLISIDAVLVLSGAVLTSYVGVTGLVRRMTLDRCLPQFFLKTNRRGSTHRIIIGFFLLAVSVLFITKGELSALAGVYTISFLAVMLLFCVGNILLKVKRARLPRPERAAWPAIMLAMLAVLIGLLGNILREQEYFKVFLYYFIPALLVVWIMLGRIGIMKAMLFMLRSASEAISGITSRMSQSIRSRIDEINSQQLVFFTRGDSIKSLNEAMLYVRKNEHSNRIKIVSVLAEGQEVQAGLKDDLAYLDRAYPEIHIEFVALTGVFGPELIEELSQEWKVPKNFMFIGSPGDHFPFRIADLGGVRLII